MHGDRYVKIFHHGIAVFACTVWRLHDIEQYNLLCRDGFTIPSGGDETGYVLQVATLARLKNSGVQKLIVDTHSITVAYSRAIDACQAADLLRRAALVAGLAVREG